MSDFQAGWVERYGDEAEQDAAEMEGRGLARVPFDLMIQTEQDAAVVVGAIQLRRDTARRIREQAEQMAAQAEREADRLEDRFTPQLRNFTERSIGDGKKKSIKLVTGQGGSLPTTLGFRSVKGGLRIVDEKKAKD